MRMIRLNITLPESVVKVLAEQRNKSRFIAEAVEEKFEREKRRKIEQLMVEGYQEAQKEGKMLRDDWEKAGLEEWE